MLTITLEEHFRSSHVAEHGAQEDVYSQFPKTLKDKLYDLSARRLSDMDAGGISHQIISHAPADALPEVCKMANDELASAISKHPTRFSGFALLPISRPEEAAQELERCVHQHRFVGALIDNHTSDGVFYDSPQYLPMFEAAQRLDVPLYIHPTFKPPGWMDRYAGNYSKAAEFSLAHYGWGWHSDTGLHILRLFAAGVFEHFPRLKIIIGHLGEMLPFQLERTTHYAESWFPENDEKGKKRKTLKDVWNTNVWITTSGMFSTNPMACVLRNTNVERIMFSVDYPFSQNKEGTAFLEELKTSGLVSERELEMIAYRNAESLLGVKANPLV